MKKNGLLKIVLCSLLLVLVLTYVLPNTSGVRNYLGIGTMVQNTIQSLAYFTDTILLIVLIGGFYGVLNKTGGYKKLLDKIVVKFKGNRNFVIFVILAFGLLASLTGISLPLLIFVPFIVSIMLLMGYDKLVAISSTVGSIIVGLIGGLFINYIDSNYGTVTTMESTLGLDPRSNLLYKILLLVGALGLLILYILKHIKNVNDKKVKYDIKDDSDILITEVKGSYKSIKTWPIITIFSVMLVILILGLVPWNSLFKIEVFNNFHTWLQGLKIGNFAIFSNIISPSFPALGEWTSTAFGNVGNQIMVMNLIIVLMIAVVLICRVKFDDAIEGFIDGIKKMIPTALLTILAYTILIIVFSNGFIGTIIKWAMELVGGFNIIVASLLTIIGSLFNIDYFYSVIGVFTVITGYIKDTSVYPLLDIMYQSLYYLVMLVGPTSVMLIFGLSYLNIPYKEWLKYIWRLVLELFILIFLILCLMLILI